MKLKKGFTLIELLVVIAIIGILSTLAIVALNTARQKSRDAKRVSDIKQIQTALELYFGDQGNKYPAEAAPGKKLGVDYTCMDHSGFVASGCTDPIYMGAVPKDPQSGTNEYTYTSTSVNTYSITFKLEGNTGDLIAGNCTATNNAINCVAP